MIDGGIEIDLKELDPPPSLVDILQQMPSEAIDLIKLVGATDTAPVFPMDLVCRADDPRFRFRLP